MKAGKTKVNNSVEAKQQSCMRLSALGRRSQAVQRLISPGLAEDTPAVRDKLLSKFPAFDHSQGPARLHPRPPTQIDVQTTDGCIKSFPNGNGPGPTGLRADFLKQCISSDEDDGCSALFAELVQLFADGNAPTYLRPWYGGGSLMGVGKAGKPLDVDARPIVAGEVWRKLTFKCTLATNRKHVIEELAPQQLSVGTPAGVDAVLHASRAWIHDNLNDSDAVLL